MSDTPLPPSPSRATDIESSSLIQKALARTPARLLKGRSGPGYRTHTWLQLLADHAAARDTVYAELDFERDFGLDLIRTQGLFCVQSRVRSKTEYLMRPDLGRQLSPNAADEIRQRCPREADIQVIIGDGLSASAVARQIPQLLTNLKAQVDIHGWRFGTPFAVRYCRVGILNDVGDLLQPVVAALLIGERPGLATDESLSAYMAYRPRSNDTDANRNLISNIHARGVGVDEAAKRIAAFAARMMQHRKSGVSIKEEPWIEITASDPGARPLASQ